VARRLTYEGRFDYFLIESNSVSEPTPVAKTFFFRHEADQVFWATFKDPFPEWLAPGQ
tara:strand:- start:1326 stop:1499 length:174 start_codon:yes stop_codon:yes gene_type:complete